MTAGENTFEVDDSFDAAQLNEMRSLAGNAFPDLVTQLENNARHAFNTLRAATSAQDAVLMKRAAHKFRGTLSTLGAKRAAAHAAELESAAQVGQFESAPVQIDQLETEYRQALAYLKTL